MPLYEYRCGKCGAHVEKIQKFSDLPLETCEKCGGKLERLLSAPTLQFKGSGWYVTDYGRKSSAAAAGTGEGAGTGKPETSSGSEPKKVSEAPQTKTPPASKPSSD